MDGLTRNFLLVGVGGQGTLLAADVVALVGMELGYDVKKSEVHGMAQRGGSVISHVRWGRRVYSALITPGEADYFLAFERLEALRYASMLRPEGILLINDYRISPVLVSSGMGTYPTQADEDKAYASMGSRRFYLSAMEIAKGLGNVRVNNVVMLGALSAVLHEPEEVWLGVISSRVPAQFVDINQQAFVEGRRGMLERLELAGGDAR